MKKISVLVLLVLLVGGLSACSVGTSKGNPCDTGEPPKIGLVTDSGGINDKSFNQGSWEGVEKYCKDTGTGATYVESKSDADYVPNLTNLTNQDGIQVVIAVGNTLGESVYQVAKDNPDTDYIIIDGTIVDKDGKAQTLDNVESFTFKGEEAGYLVGYIAGEETKTDKVGFVGGMEIPPVEDFGFGYVQGVQAANPDAEVYYQYSGTFDDATKGQQITSTMYSKGVDIVFTCAGAVNDGVINAAKSERNDDNKVWVIGVDRDLYDEGKISDDESVILTSALKNVNEAAYEGLQDEFSDDFGGKTIDLGYEDGGVGLPDENPSITDSKVITKAEDSLKNTTVDTDPDKVEKDIQNLDIKGKLI